MLICTKSAYSNLNNNHKILLFGDSIIAGYGIKTEDDMAHQLKKAFTLSGYDNIEIINAGVSGDTTSGGSNRLAWALSKHKPSIVIIGLGGNDALRAVPVEVVRQNVRKMLEITRDKNVITILNQVEVPANLGIKYKSDFETVYKQAAKDYNVALYPFFLKDLYGSSQYMQADGIHPNKLGIKKITEKLAPFIEEKILKDDLTQRTPYFE